MFNFLKKKEEPKTFHSFGAGLVVPLEDVPDPVFSEKMMGDGYAIELSDGKITAPISGELTAVFPTGHAFGIMTNDGIEILIHIGIDTIELNGKGFELKVKQEEKVKQGDVLVEIDIDYIKSKDKSLISPIVFTSGEKINILKQNEVVKNDTLDIFEFV